MNKNKINNILYYFILTFGLFFIFNDDVIAKDKVWPGVSATSLPGDTANMEYCVYNTGTIYTSNSGFTAESSIYSNNSYIIINNSNEKALYFFDSNKGAQPASGSYSWDKTFFNQNIIFATDLYDYLVDEQGTLSCKQLVFMETGNVSIFSSSGSLSIYTPDSLISEYFGVLSDRVYEINTITSSGITGSHYGESIATKCNNYELKVKSISDNYYEKQKEPFEKLQAMATSEFSAGDAELAKKYYDDLISLLNQTGKDLANAGIATNVNGEGFYMGSCSSLQSAYKKIKGSVESAYFVAESYYSQIIGKFNAALSKSDNPSQFDNDKQILGEIGNSISNSKSEWAEYLDQINLGTELVDATCEGILGPDLLDDISTILTYIRIAVPILVIVLGSIDFAKAVLSDEQQELKKSGSRFIKRCIIAILIFFVPTLIMYLISFVDKIADVSCDIRLW